MNKYPYNDSTDMVIYDSPNGSNKKKKKQRVWPAVLLSALVASIVTAGACTTGYYFISKNQAQQVANNAQVASTEVVATDSTDGAATMAYKNGKKVLSIPEIASKVGPSVVGVINKTKVSAQKYYDPFSGRYYYYQDPSAGADDMVEQGSGSGIIISDDGYIVTNQHVIDGASGISVILNTGDEVEAKLIGQDTKTDLAVLKISTDKEIHPATLGDSTQIQVGETAVAIGNPMGMEFSGSVTAGIISAVNRTMTIEDRTYNLLQTDAAINSGNSGGALINQYGEVIGINSVKLSQAGVEGMGFAIAISEAKPIIDSLMESGHVSRPFVGISISTTKYGLFVNNVVKGSGAEEAGIKENDMILEVDGTKVETVDEINKIRDTKKIGDSLKFKISRDGEAMEFDVKLTDTIEDNGEAAATEEEQQQPEQQNPYGNQGGNSNRGYGGGMDDFWDFFNFFR